MKLPGFFTLRGISGQIAALWVASIVTLHLIITAIFLFHRPDQAEPAFDHGHNEIAASIQLLGAADPAERPRLFADIARAFPHLDIEAMAPDAAVRSDDNPNFEQRMLRRHLGAGYRVVSLGRDGDARKVGISLPDGTMISARLLPDPRPRPFWTSPWMTTLLFAVISLILLSL